MNTILDWDKILEALNLKGKAATELMEKSNWRKHLLEGYEEHTLWIRNPDGQALTANQINALRYYFEKEAVFYEKIIQALSMESESFWDKYLYDIECCLEENEMEVPEKLEVNWLLNNVKLISVSLQRELEDSCFLELDFAVSWDEEHGMRALLYKDRLLAFGQGGMCWSFDLDAYETV